jgi:hypothetical protein
LTSTTAVNNIVIIILIMFISFPIDSSIAYGSLAFTSTIGGGGVSINISSLAVGSLVSIFPLPPMLWWWWWNDNDCHFLSKAPSPCGSLAFILPFII